MKSTRSDSGNPTLDDKTSSSKPAEVIVGGDVVPRARSIDALCSGEANRVFGQFVDVFAEASLSLVNLECPLTDEKKPIPKVGKNFIASIASIAGIKASGIDLVNLANNHIMDQGEQGLSKTIEACEQRGIHTVGAGPDIEAARKGFQVSLGGTNLRVDSSAESEFSIAGPGKSGANPICPIAISRKLGSYGQNDFGIYLLHAGREHYPYPSPNLQQLCRFIVEQGARVVICQHSHCVGTFERYRDGLIVYGQGNLVFDRYPNRAPTWYEGFLVKLNIRNPADFSHEFLPYIQYREQGSVVPLDPEARETFLADLNRRSQILTEPELVEKKWREHCLEYKHKYMSILRGHGGLLKALNQRLHLTNLTYRGLSLRYLLNTIRCETHREILETILEMETE